MVNTIKNNKHKVKTEKQMVRKDTKINQQIVLKLGETRGGKSTKPFQCIKKLARILTSYYTIVKKSR